MLKCTSFSQTYDVIGKSFKQPKSLQFSSDCCKKAEHPKMTHDFLLAIVSQCRLYSLGGVTFLILERIFLDPGS